MASLAVAASTNAIFTADGIEEVFSRLLGLLPGDHLILLAVERGFHIGRLGSRYEHFLTVIADDRDEGEESAP